MLSLLLVVGLSLFVSFVCSVLEAVFLRMSHSYIALLQERGISAGDRLARMRSRMDEPIGAILTLNTIAHTVGATLSGAIALQVLGSQWMAVFSAMLTIAILVLSEIVPKTVGAHHWQRLAIPTAYVLEGLILLLKPILIPLRTLNRWIAPRDENRQPTISRAELEVLAEIGRREGTIDEEEWEVVTNVMNLDQVTVGEVMTPRTIVVALPVEASVEEAKRTMLAEGHLRVPVYEGSIDNVVGLLLARDLWQADAQGVSEIRHLLRTPLFVPSSKAVETLLQEMRLSKMKMAIVLDEFGGTAGIVTLEDLIEEIIGEIQDEHELEPLDFEVMDDGVIRMEGSVSISDVNERFSLSLPADMYDTLGGFVFGEFGHVPEPGAELTTDIGTFRVLSMDGRRVERVAFYPAEQAAEEESQAERE